MKKFLYMYTALVFVGCDGGSTAAVQSPSDPDASKYHENSFSFDSTVGGTVAARTLSSKTTFTRKQLDSTVKVLATKLQQDRAWANSLSKPVDYVCDELLLALFNQYGNVWIGDSLVLSQDLLKKMCKYTGENAVKAAPRSAISAAGGWSLSSQADDRQYPYKMIGTSWANFDALVYKSTGGETDFQKYRRKYLTSAWWGLDADHIGVRIYLFNKVPVLNNPAIFILQRSTSDFYSGSSSVSKREFAVGITIGGTFGGSLSSVDVTKRLDLPNPTLVNAQFSNVVNKSGSGWVSQAANFVADNIADIYPAIFAIAQSLGYPNLSAMPADATVCAGVVSLHSVDHGSMKFRSVSGAGLSGNINIITNGFSTLDFLTW
jgi:hypothetical protein